MARRRRSRRPWRQIWRYWGLILVVVMVVSLDRHLGVLPYAIMTLLVVIWSLFVAPTWCGAVNRRRGREIEYCRNNSSGLLLGCRIHQHKFQRFKSAWWQTTWRERTAGLWTGAQAKFATISGVLGILTGILGIVIDLVPN
jgi:hypothetical protein